DAERRDAVRAGVDRVDGALAVAELDGTLAAAERTEADAAGRGAARRGEATVGCTVEALDDVAGGIVRLRVERAAAVGHRGGRPGQHGEQRDGGRDELGASEHRYLLGRDLD